MKIKDAKSWCKALRSGEYKQGRHYLKKRGKYCCLGVLNDLFSELNLASTSSNVLDNYNRIGLSNYRGLLYTQGKWSMSLSELNDWGYGKIPAFSFDEIADIIELKYVHKAF